MERFTNYYRAKGSYSRTGVEAKKASKGDKAEDREVGSDSVVKHFASMTPGQEATDTAGMEKNAYPQCESVEEDYKGMLLRKMSDSALYALKKSGGASANAAAAELKYRGKLQDTNEEVEKLDELSPGTLQSYKDKAKKEVGELEPHTKKGGEYRDIAKRLQAKRRAGIVRSGARLAGAKPTRESVEELDELSKDTLASYKKKAGADASAADKAGDFKRGNKRFSGIMKATKKEFDKANESVELDEASHVVHITSTDKSGKKEMRTGHVVAQSKSAAINIAKKHYQDQGHTIHAVHYGPKRTPVKEEVELDEASDINRATRASIAKASKESNRRIAADLYAAAKKHTGDDAKHIKKAADYHYAGHGSKVGTHMSTWSDKSDAVKKAIDDAQTKEYKAHLKRAGVKTEEVDLDEKTLTPAEVKKREEIAQAMERENPGMPMDKKMAIATAQAKKVAEELTPAQKAQRLKMITKVGNRMNKKNADAEKRAKRDAMRGIRKDKDYMDEANDTKPPFEGPYRKRTDNVTDKSGAKHTPMSRARHLARMAMQKKQKTTESIEIQSFSSFISEAKVDVAAIAKELETYAKKSGGIDKKDFMDLVAQMKRTNKLPSKKDVMGMDTDPREFVLGLIYGHSDSATLKKYYGVSM